MSGCHSPLEKDEKWLNKVNILQVRSVQCVDCSLIKHLGRQIEVNLLLLEISNHEFELDYTPRDPMPSRPQEK